MRTRRTISLDLRERILAAYDALEGTREDIARRFGSPERVEAFRAEILKLQHADGGWGWMIAEAQSDSLEHIK